MKLTCAIAAIVVILADAAQGFRLPAIIEPLQQQPKCSPYSGFKDSPSFTSFCKQLPRATRPFIDAMSTQATAFSSAKKTPSISTQLFTFDGGRTSTMSPVHPAISSAAASKTFELPDYIITTSVQTSSSKAVVSFKPVPTDLEVNCYISGSKLPASECTRTAGLTRHHGYTYSHSTKPNTKPALTSFAAIASSSKKASGTAASATKPASSSGKAASSTPVSSKAASSGAALRPSNATTSALVTGRSSSGPGTPTSLKCTRTMNLTHVHGYTYTAGTAPGASTAKLTSSVVASSSSKSATSSTSKSATSSTTKIAASSTTKVTSSNATTSTPLGIGASSTFRTTFVNSYDCNNITAAEPHRMGSSTEAASTTSAPSTSTTSSAKTQSTSSSKASPPSQSAQSQTTSSSTPGSRIAKTTPCSSTTTLIDATVTTLVPCATDISKPPKEKRDPGFMKATAGGMCDAGVYCVNSTFVSDAPPSWHWNAVALKMAQVCLEDNVFNTEWVEAQCACAGL